VRLTIRARLTLVYGGLFLIAGGVLLAVTYLLASAQLLHGDPTPQERRPPAVAVDRPPSQGDMPVVVRQAREATLRQLLSQGAIALGLVGVTAIGAGWLVAGRMLQPVQRITATARRIADAPAADRGLAERIALAGPRDELKELADTFDLMLERLDHSFDSQRRFIANASHELRTPLALNRTVIEVALDAETTPPETRWLGATLLSITARQERLIEGLLLLARSERELTKRAYLDLADVAEHVVANLDARGSAGSVDVRTDFAEAPTTGDAALLERLVHNLVDNGVKHNLADGTGWVHVGTSGAPDGTVEVSVGNSGPVVPRHEVPNLFAPFHRLDRERPGAGLGLSIVRSVALAHGGEVHAEPRDGGGLVVVVTLPGAPVIRSGF
jgi:signal transduction histidine kinase